MTFSSDDVAEVLRRYYCYDAYDWAVSLMPIVKRCTVCGYEFGMNRPTSGASVRAIAHSLVRYWHEEELDECVGCLGAIEKLAVTADEVWSVLHDPAMDGVEPWFGGEVEVHDD